jgi:large subunit ribosomal protein L24
MARIRMKRGDQIQVIAGADKGKQGRILAVFPKTNRVLVEGIKMITKHEKPNQKNQQGGKVTKEAPIHVSNVKVI